MLNGDEVEWRAPEEEGTYTISVLVEDDGGENDSGSVDIEASIGEDLDGDGYTASEGDCDDGDASIYPGAEDACADGIDQDCDGIDPSCDGIDLSLADASFIGKGDLSP